ncbi:serine protease inhibitor 3-like [Ptiloglossa arizonensis]|uniref:serine protease inhibitor 3-like n=1 Tax=Ptiloglossa arizonensis TaxID=3350558 RepID=UPI003FA083AA
MSSKFFVFLCLLVIVSSVALGQESGRRCVAGKSYYDGCNWCYCHQAGFIGCTKKGCTTTNPETGETVEVEKIEPPDDFWQTVE